MAGSKSFAVNLVIRTSTVKRQSSLEAESKLRIDGVAKM